MATIMRVDDRIVIELIRIHFDNPHEIFPCGMCREPIKEGDWGLLVTLNGHDGETLIDEYHVHCWDHLKRYIDDWVQKQIQH